MELEMIENKDNIEQEQLEREQEQEHQEMLEQHEIDGMELDHESSLEEDHELNENVEEEQIEQTKDEEKDNLDDDKEIVDVRQENEVPRDVSVEETEGQKLDSDNTIVTTPESKNSEIEETSFSEEDENISNKELDEKPHNDEEATMVDSYVDEETIESSFNENNDMIIEDNSDCLSEQSWEDDIQEEVNDAVPENQNFEKTSELQGDSFEDSDETRTDPGEVPDEETDVQEESEEMSSDALKDTENSEDDKFGNETEDAAHETDVIKESKEIETEHNSEEETENDVTKGSEKVESTEEIEASEEPEDENPEDESEDENPEDEPENENPEDKPAKENTDNGGYKKLIDAKALASIGNGTTFGNIKVSGDGEVKTSTVVDQVKKDATAFADGLKTGNLDINGDTVKGIQKDIKSVQDIKDGKVGTDVSKKPEDVVLGNAKVSEVSERPADFEAKDSNHGNETSESESKLEVSQELKDSLESFSQDKWDGLSTDERKEAIGNLADSVANELGLENKPDVRYYQFDRIGDYGGYSASENAIYINENSLDDAKETVDTIAHESRHCWQHEYAEKSDSPQAQEFRENFEDYIRPEDDYREYKNQPVEKDAREYASGISDLIDTNKEDFYEGATVESEKTSDIEAVESTRGSPEMSIPNDVMDKHVENPEDYTTQIDSKVTEISHEKIVDNPDKQKEFEESFKDGVYRTVVTNEPITLYRVYGGTAKEQGAFATTNPAISREQVKNDSALLTEWGNTCEHEVTIVVPAGTKLHIGRVEKQWDEMTNEMLKGDSDQIMLPYGWPDSWIVDRRDIER